MHDDVLSRKREFSLIKNGRRTDSRVLTMKNMRVFLYSCKCSIVVTILSA